MDPIFHQKKLTQSQYRSNDVDDSQNQDIDFDIPDISSEPQSVLEKVKSKTLDVFKLIVVDLLPEDKHGIELHKDFLKSLFKQLGIKSK